MNATVVSAANEKEVWTGTPSQLRHLALYSLCAVVALALLIAAITLRAHLPWWIPVVLILIPAFVAGKRYLQTACEHLTLTDQRLIRRAGIFNRTTDYVELYRIKDTHFTQPLFERLLGLGTITLRTTQDNAPHIVLDGMHGADALWNQIRDLVEDRRTAKGVREMDLNTEVGG